MQFPYRKLSESGSGRSFHTGTWHGKRTGCDLVLATDPDADRLRRICKMTAKPANIIPDRKYVRMPDRCI